MNLDLIHCILRAKDDYAEFARFFLGIEISADFSAMLNKAASLNKTVVLRGKRRSGKSLAIEILALHKSIFNPNLLNLVVVKNQDQRLALLSKFTRIITMNSDTIGMFTVDRTCIKLQNNSKILVLTSSELHRNVAGITVNNVYVDELQSFEYTNQVSFIQNVFPKCSISNRSQICISIDEGILGNSPVIDAIEKNKEYTTIEYL